MGGFLQTSGILVRMAVTQELSGKASLSPQDSVVETVIVSLLEEIMLHSLDGNRNIAPEDILSSVLWSFSEFVKLERLKQLLSNEGSLNQ
jgi:hypothetical protein